MDIIIVTWNGRQDTIAALEEVQRQIEEAAAACRARAVVVDNGSVDGTDSAVAGKFPAVRLLRLRENRGFTGGVAAGIAVSSADYAVLLNNDAIPSEGWLRSLVKRIQEAPEDVVAVGGKIVDPTSTLLDFGGGVVTFDGHAFQVDFRRRLADIEEAKDGSEILFACGGNMIVRRPAFVDLGGFDDDYFAYLEDVDFGWRAWLSGHRILYARDAVVRHKSSATSNRLGSFERGVLFERNALATAVKNYDQETFGRVAGPIFLTLLHRLHHYTVARSAGTEALTRRPLGEIPGGRATGAGESRLSRWRRRLASAVNPRAVATIEDPHAVMQFRAVDWFFENQDLLMHKREEIQKRRTRTDAEIFARFPIHYVPTYPGDRQLMDSRIFKALMPQLPSRTRSLDEIMKL